MAEAGAEYVVGPDDDPDRCRLRRQVGGGGETSLWEADVAIDGERERVAIRILSPELGGDASWLAQVELLRQVHHPGVVGVRAAFEGAAMHRPGEVGGERARYVVTDWVDGEDVRSWVPRHRRKADLAEALRLVGQVATTLDLLHSGAATATSEPVVHGDIGPASVMVNRDGQAVLVDLGLPRVAGGASGYSAPEVAEGGAADPASDRYAFGGLAYYVLTGTHPPVEPDTLRAGLAGLAAQPDEAATAPAELTAIAALDPAGRPGAADWFRLLREQLSTTSALAAEPGGSGWLRSRWFAAVASAALAALVVLGIGVGTDLFSTPAESSGAGPTASPTGPPAPSPAPPAAPSPATVAPTSPGSDAPPAGRPGPSPWPGEPDGTVYIVGNVELEVCDTACTRFFDLDQNQGSIIEGRPETDVSATRDGLGLQNQAQVVAWQGSEPPTLEDCRSVPALEWTVPLIDAETFDEPSTFCIHTDQGRFGYLQTQQSEASEYRFYYVLWMRPGDA